MKKVIWAAAAIGSAMPAFAADVEETLTTAIEWAARNPVITARIFVVAVITITIHEILHHLSKKISKTTSIGIGALFGILVMVFMPSPLLLLIGGLWMTVFAIALILIPAGGIYLLTTIFPKLKIPLYVLGIIILGYIIYATGEVKVTGAAREVLSSVQKIGGLGILGFVAGLILTGGAGKLWEGWKKKEEKELDKAKRDAEETKAATAALSAGAKKAGEDISKLAATIDTTEKGLEGMEAENSDDGHLEEDITNEQRTIGRISPQKLVNLAAHEDRLKSRKQMIEKEIAALKEMFDNVRKDYAGLIGSVSVIDSKIKETLELFKKVPESLPVAFPGAELGGITNKINIEILGKINLLIAEITSSARPLSTKFLTMFKPREGTLDKEWGVFLASAAALQNKIIEILSLYKNVPANIEALKTKRAEFKGILTGILKNFHTIKDGIRDFEGSMLPIPDKITGWSAVEEAVVKSADEVTASIRGLEEEKKKSEEKQKKLAEVKDEGKVIIDALKRLAIQASADIRAIETLKSAAPDYINSWFEAFDAAKYDTTKKAFEGMISTVLGFSGKATAAGITGERLTTSAVQESLINISTAYDGIKQILLVVKSEGDKQKSLLSQVATLNGHIKRVKEMSAHLNSLNNLISSL